MSSSAFRRIEEMVAEGMRRHPEPPELPASIVRDLVRDGVRPEEIDRIIAPAADLDSRIHNRQPLTRDQTERAVRLAHVVDLATGIFANSEKAFLWLRLPNAELGGLMPIEYLTSESGARFVEEILVRIDHGIAA